MGIHRLALAQDDQAPGAGEVHGLLARRLQVAPPEVRRVARLGPRRGEGPGDLFRQDLDAIQECLPRRAGRTIGIPNQTGCDQPLFQKLCESGIVFFTKERGIEDGRR